MFYKLFIFQNNESFYLNFTKEFKKYKKYK